MDLMNAMMLPQTPEKSRISQPPRKKQEEAPLVSFPTMLERNANQEAPQEAARTSRPTETPTEKAPTTHDSGQDPAAKSGTGPTTEGGTSEVRSAAAATTPTELAPGAAQGVTFVRVGQPVAPVPGTPQTAQAPEASAISLGDVPEEALLDIPAADPTKGPVAGTTGPTAQSATPAGTPQMVAGSTPPGSQSVKPGIGVADPVLPDSETAVDGETEGEISASRAEANPNSAPGASGDGEIEIVAMESSEPTTTSESAQAASQEAAASPAEVSPEATQTTASTADQVAPAAVEEAAAQQAANADTQQSIKIQNARRTYEQPHLAAGAEETKITLADLNLDSGSLDSFLSRDSLATMLKTAVARNTPLHQHIRAQVSRQVVDHLRSEMAGQRLTLRLNPEELGQVEINFHALDDKLTISMNAEGKQAQAALKDGARDLADNIGEKSSRFSMVEVRVETRGQQDQSRQDARQEDQRKERGNEQNASQQQEQQRGRQHQAPSHQIGADEWAAFHLGGQ